MKGTLEEVIVEIPQSSVFEITFKIINGEERSELTLVSTSKNELERLEKTFKALKEIF